MSAEHLIFASVVGLMALTMVDVLLLHRRVKRLEQSRSKDGGE